jgi:hypothetical protein
MNERIRKLAEQAEKYADYNFKGEIFWTEAYESKFAELIVEECIAIVKPTSHHEAWAQSYLGGVDGLELLEGKIENIKEHFGVEE